MMLTTMLDQVACTQWKFVPFSPKLL